MFVKINNRILDFNELVKDRILVKNHLIIQLEEMLKTYGFEKQDCHYINEDLNCKIKIKLTKDKKEVFV